MSDDNTGKPNTRERTAAAPPNYQEIRRFAERLLIQNRNELLYADAKATRWLGGTCAGVLAVFTAMFDQGYGSQPLWTLNRWAWWGACALSVFAVGSFAAALLPRLRGEDNLSHVAYFHQVYKLSDTDVIRRYVESAAMDSMPGLIAQVRWTSRIVVVKYRYIKAGIAFVALSFGTLIVCLL